MYVCMSVYVCVCVCVFLCVYVQCAVRTYNLPLDLNLTTQCSNCPGWPAVCVKRLHNLAEPCRVVELSLYRRKKPNFMLSEVRPLLWAPSVLLAMPPPPRLAETSAATFWPGSSNTLVSSNSKITPILLCANIFERNPYQCFCPSNIGLHWHLVSQSTQGSGRLY